MASLTTEEHGSTVTLHIEGSLTFQSINSVVQAWNEVLNREPEAIVIDLSFVEYIDSLGISSLVKLSQNAANNHISLTLKNVNDNLYSLLRTACVHSLFRFQ